MSAAAESFLAGAHDRRRRGVPPSDGTGRAPLSVAPCPPPTAATPAPSAPPSTASPAPHPDGRGAPPVVDRSATRSAGPSSPSPVAPPPSPAGTPRTSSAPEPRATGAAVTVRLAPRVEPPARALGATTPAHVTAPVLGTVEARARTRPRAVPGQRAGEPASAAGPMPDPTPLCCAMVQAAVEGLRGVRPLAQLTRWVSPEVYERLQLRAELVHRAGSPQSARAGIRRIRVFRIGDEVAEASVVVDDGPRVRAVAVRLEAHRGRWRAVAMEIG